jgi:VIT1/CCC1 family predicted Fe2+/Mn2+ transporter
MYLPTRFSNQKSTLLVGTVTLFLLSLPLLAMQFTSEVNWSVFDFLVAGIMLIGFGSLLSFISGRKIYSLTTRKAAIILAIITFLCIWLELAVGVFNTPIAGN